MSGHPDFQPVDPSVVPRFADIATFMRTRRHEISEAVDIGLVGVPFDIGLNYRSGARQGPAGVREASRVIRRVHPSSLIRPFEICNVADLGIAALRPSREVRKHGHVFIPGRHVGAEEVEDDGEPFGAKIERLTAALAAQMAEGRRPAAAIEANLTALSFGEHQWPQGESLNVCDVRLLDACSSCPMRFDRWCDRRE